MVTLIFSKQKMTKSEKKMKKQQLKPPRISTLTSENLMRNKNQQRIAITLRKKTIM
jgi:hypothetical protein